MKKIQVYLLSLVIALPLLASCEQTTGTYSDGTYDVYVSVADNSAMNNDSIDSVYISLDNKSLNKIIKIEAYQKGNFTMRLPMIINDALLNRISDMIPNGVTVSDASAKGAECYFFLMSSSKQVGELYYSNTVDIPSEKFSKVTFFYSNKSLIISGRSIKTNDYDDSINDTVDYHVTLKAGWNLIGVNNRSDTYMLLTSAIPSNLNWHTIPDSYFNSISLKRIKNDDFKGL